MATGNGNGQTLGISDAAMTVLQNHRSPGNVRELQNAIERALMLCDDDEVQSCHLPPAILRSPTMTPQPALKQASAINLVDSVEQHERSIIVVELQKHNWNQTRAAASLGVSRRILAYKLQNLGIERPTSEPTNIDRAALGAYNYFNCAARCHEFAERPPSRVVAVAQYSDRFLQSNG